MSATLRQSLRGAVAALIILAPPAASARPVRVWTLEELAKQAFALAAAEVRGTRRVKAINRNGTRWRIDLFEMEATLRVLRVFPRDHTPGLKPRQTVSLRYWAIDWQKTTGICNGPSFPELRAGDVLVFPLSLRRGGEEAPWELIDEEDYNLLVPAARPAPPDGKAATATEFLRLELVGAFARGRHADAFKAAKYLGSVRSDRAAEDLLPLVERHVGKDERRWLDVATAAYCAMGTPRPKVAELLRPAPRRRPQAALAATAFRHVRRDGLDERFIANCIRHAGVHTWGAAVAIKENYPRHPTAMTLLARALTNDAPEAIQIAHTLIRSGDHPLARAAADAAARLLARRRRVELNDWPHTGYLRAACALVRDHGTDKQFALLLDELKHAQKADLTRYAMIWQSCAYVKHPRLLSICRILIEDRTDFPSAGDRRFCDVAALRVEWMTGRRFGFVPGETTAARDKVIARIRAWLAEQPR